VPLRECGGNLQAAGDGLVNCNAKPRACERWKCAFTHIGHGIPDKLAEQRRLVELDFQHMEVFYGSADVERVGVGNRSLWVMGRESDAVVRKNLRDPHHFGWAASILDIGHHHVISADI
jgi:hypothetical protein